MSNLSTWELFRDEIERNITPKKHEIECQFKFLIEKQIVNSVEYTNLVHVRYLAAYMQALKEYLHPSLILSQGNIQSEMLFFGTLYEGVIIKLINFLILNNHLNWQTINQILNRNDNNHLTLFQSIKVAKELLEFIPHELLNLVDDLRKERNKVHLDNILPTGLGESNSEEFRLIEIRRKFDFFLDVIKIYIENL